jgi:hypothetical protein
MGIQITTQPQVLKTDTVIIGNNSNNLSAVSGLTVYGDVSASGSFSGDGSKLTGLVATGISGISLVNSIDGLTGNITNAYVPLSGDKNITGSLTAVSGTFAAVSAGVYYGDGSKLTGLVASGITGISLVNSIDGLTGAVTNAYVPLSGGKTITGPLTSTGNLFLGSNNVNNILTQVIANSADWNIGKTLSSSGGRLGGNTTVQGNLTANYITALSGSTFVNTIFTTTSSLCVISGPINVGPAFYVGANGTGDIASFYDLGTGVEMLHIAGSDGTNPNVGVKTSFPNKDFTVNGEISAVSGAWFDRITLKTNITAVSGFFTSGVSGTHYGDGSKLTGVVATSLGNVSLVNSIDGLTGAITNAYVPLTGGKTITGSLTSNGLSSTNLTAVNATIRNTLSTVTISADNLVVSGYPLQAVSRVYQVGTTAATSTYTLALSDNNNTLTMYVGTSGLIIIPNTITFPIGFQTNIMQLSTGRVTLSAQGSNLYNDMNSFKTYKQYSAATVINLGSLWVAYGALSS